MSTEAIAAEKPKRNYNALFGLTLLALLVLLWVILSVSTQSFASANNISNLLRQGSMIAILAVGQTFVIITGGIDLSVGAVVGFATVITAMLINAGVPVFAAILITLLVGVAIGLFHGFGIVRMGLPPFIITLATLTSLRGIGLLMTNGNSISINNDAFQEFSRNSFVGIPNLFWMVILVGIPAYIFLHHSRWGRYLFSVGSNAEASRLSGVNVQRTIYMAYTLSGLCAAFVGVLLASRIGIGNPTQAEGWELQAIASSVIGGISLFGGRGSILGTLFGAMIVGVVSMGLNMMGADPQWKVLLTGVLIIVIVYFDGLRRRGK
ncbi:MAG: ABC transporter permease [Mesorhizobium sp.]|nr:MAG: ABC transporter permease [Mesorhizobium sp.]